MLIRTGLGGQLSGSVGGVVASHNKGGQYLRNRSVPTNPNSGRQQLVRGAMSSAAAGWQGLTAGQRAAWEGYAEQTPVVNRLGESITISGFNMYCRTFVFYASCDDAGSVPTAAPATPGQSVLGPFTSTTYSAATGLNIAGGVDDVNGPGLISVSPALSPGVSYFKGPFTAFQTTNDLSGEDGIDLPGNQAVNRYGVPAAGEIRCFRVAGADDTGKLSNVIEFKLTIAV